MSRQLNGGSSQGNRKEQDRCHLHTTFGRVTCMHIHEPLICACRFDFIGSLGQSAYNINIVATMYTCRPPLLCVGEEGWRRGGGGEDDWLSYIMLCQSLFYNSPTNITSLRLLFAHRCVQLIMQYYVLHWHMSCQCFMATCKE